MNGDAVFWGSIATVVIAIVIFVFLAFKIRSLMKSDAEKHNS
ncbi:MAG: hypothetical protein AB2784_06985 [Candidatus Thiodiazotropha endolucinida]